MARGFSIVYAAAGMRQSIIRFAISSSLLSCALLSASGCAPKLGDGCELRSDCSVNDDRECDLSQPGGYCTIANCEPDSCGEDGVCVRFQPDQLRLSSDWCMATCSETGDCDRDAYVCRSEKQLNAKVPKGEPRVAAVLEGKKSQKFCVVKE